MFSLFSRNTIQFRGCGTAAELAERLTTGLAAGKKVSFRSFAAVFDAGILFKGEDLRAIMRTCSMGAREAEQRKDSQLAAELRLIQSHCGRFAAFFSLSHPKGRVN
jgi:hypothetical protein